MLAWRVTLCGWTGAVDEGRMGELAGGARRPSVLSHWTECDCAANGLLFSFLIAAAVMARERGAGVRSGIWDMTDAKKRWETHGWDGRGQGSMKDERRRVLDVPSAVRLAYCLISQVVTHEPVRDVSAVSEVVWVAASSVALLACSQSQARVYGN